VAREVEIRRKVAPILDHAGRIYFDSVSAMLRSFPATCDILKSNLIRRILKRCFLAGNSAKSFVLSNGTKGLFASSGTLSHYDPNKESIVSADASSFGIGAVIRQKRGESLRPVAYASRSMSDTEMLC
jgi:hypothetical protein